MRNEWGRHERGLDELGSNYTRLAVTESDETTQLYVEVESWNSTAEDAWLWVSRDNWTISSSEDTTLYLYYDNNHADNDEFVGATGSTPGVAVWDSNFVFVTHMADSSDSGHIGDSTSNGATGTKTGAGAPQEVTDSIHGTGQQFDPSGQKIDLDNEVSSPSAFTVEILWKWTGNSTGSDPTYHQLLDHIAGGSNLKNYFLVGKVGVDYYARVTTNEGLKIHPYYFMTPGNVEYIGYIWDGTQIYGIEDGVLDTPTSANGTLVTGTTPLTIGRTGNYQVNGVIYEIRISDAVRSAAWIKAAYYTWWDDMVSYYNTPHG